MQLTVYGNNATCPEPGGACACYLVEAAGVRVLFDMGNGSLSFFGRGYDLAALDAIVISHLHFDHFGDLFCAKYQLESRRAYGEPVPVLPLYAPRLPDWAAAELLDNGVFDYHAVSDGTAFCVGGVRVRAYAMRHLVESYGFRITDGRRTLAYSGDTGVCDALAPLCAGCDTLLCEATFHAGMGAEEGHHLSAATAGALARQAGAGALLLTHYHAGNAARILKEAQAAFPAARLTGILGQYDV